MKKLIVAPFLAVLMAVSMVAGPSFADQITLKTPSRVGGGPAYSEYAGYKHTYKATAAEAMICTGRCLLAGLIVGTGATSTSLRVRDTAAADGLLGNKALPDYFYHTSDSRTQGPGLVAQPMRFDDGIAVSLSSIAANESVTVLWVQLNSE